MEDKMKNTENMSKEEQIGFHKGSLSTLSKERQELSKMMNVVEQLMQMHIKQLKELGVDLEAQAKEAEKQKKEQGSQEGENNKDTSKKIDDLI